MSDLKSTSFGYSFVPGVSQYSAGVIADEGYEIERLRFLDTPPLDEAFLWVERFLKSERLPITALCAFEMRSPTQFDEAGFRTFNQRYLGQVQDWGIAEGDRNPIARSNVVPVANPPKGIGVHAFSYVRPRDAAPRTFVVAGSGEVPEGMANYADHIIAPGDTSAGGIRRKADFVLQEMRRRLQILGYDWGAASDVQVYTEHEFHHVMQDQLAGQLPTSTSVAWHFCQPPVQGLAFEMDTRRVFHQRSVVVA